jgi:arylsulfatase
LKAILSLLAVLVLAFRPVPSTAADAPRKPNILLILADDLGWSDLGCYGGEIPTPHLDRLAAEGLRFRQFYNNAVCGPTRASVLTGLHCQQIGHSGTHWNQPTDFRKCVSVGEVLQTAGYRTLLVGKWQERDLPAKRGFHRFFGPMCQAKVSYFHEVQQNPFYLDEQRWQFPGADFYMTDAFTDHAVRFIQEATTRKEALDRTRPFFLYLAYLAPHWPLHAREKDIAPHRARYRQLGWDECRQQRFQRQRDMGLIRKEWSLSPRPAVIHDWKADKDQEWQAERMAVYAAQVASIDRGVGKVLEAVRRAGVADNTLVLFLSDNGAAPDGGVSPTKRGFGFEPNKKNDTWRLDRVPIRPGSGPDNLPGPADTFAAYGLAWATVSNTPLRSTKLLAYEGGIRTPLIAHWPAVIRKGGQMTDQAGHVVDLMATCLDVAGAAYPTDFQGRKPLPLEGKSLVPIFRGAQRAGHEWLYWHAPQNQAVRSGRWKLVNAGRGKPWELYDLEADGTETQNLVSKHPDRVRGMATRWRNWAKQSGLPGND